MSLTKRILTGMKDKAEGLAKQGADKAKELFEQGKEQIYKGASTLEQTAGKEEGIVGTVKGAARTVVQKGKEFYQTVEDKGGIIETVGVVTDKVLVKTDEALTKLTAVYAKTEDSLFTDGKYDPKKGKKFLEDRTENAKVFGVKTYQTLADLVSKGVQAVENDYRKIVPSQEEMKTTYVGIGTAYEGKKLLRPNLDACLEYHAKAKRVLPGGLKARVQILGDIKASASVNTEDLIGFYGKKGDTSKVSVLKKYL